VQEALGVGLAGEALGPLNYGVSKATVTRTLRILADEGLVRVIPRWGTFRA
jgi:Fe2+ or Zn2+ uptake regulation protein